MPGLFSEEYLNRQDNNINSIRQPIIQIEKLSQTTTNGIFLTNLRFRVRDYVHCRQIVSSPRHMAQCQLDDNYQVFFRYYPFGCRNVQTVALLVALCSDDGDDVYMKFKSTLLDRDGNVSCLYMMNRYYCMPYKVYWLVQKVGDPQHITANWDRYVNNGEFHYNMKISLDLNKKPIQRPVSEEDRKTMEKLRIKIHSEHFGDTAFIVGGVAFFAHENVLMRNNAMFRSTLPTTEKKGLHYEFNDIYPQVFEKFVIECYMKDRQLDKK